MRDSRTAQGRVIKSQQVRAETTISSMGEFAWELQQHSDIFICFLCKTCAFVVCVKKIVNLQKLGSAFSDIYAFLPRKNFINSNKEHLS